MLGCPQMGSLGDEVGDEIPKGCPQMGSFGDDVGDEVPNVDFFNFHAQPSGTQILYSPLPGENNRDDNELPLAESGMPFEDTCRVEDMFDETQVVNLGGETQILDDPGCLENMDTQVIDEFYNQVVVDSDGEGTDATEIFINNDKLSDDEIGSGNCKKLDGENIQDTSLHKQGKKGLMEQPHALIDEQHNLGPHVSTEKPTVQISPESKPGLCKPVDKISTESRPGSVPRFTSIRVKSLRASALAARNLALKSTNSESCGLLTYGHSQEQHTLENNVSKTKAWEEIDQFRNAWRDDDEINGLRNESKWKVGNSTVRKLFAEEPYAENEGLPEGNIVGQNGCDAGLAGLSYVDSQEPGELSQANALACVQKLIEENKGLFDNEDNQRSSTGKLNHSSAAKGPQRLAKKANDRGTNGKAGIFDWDDGREDEGGGDFFCRKKEEFFGGSLSERSFTKPQKAVGNQLSGHRHNGGKSNVENEVFYSDSRMLLCKSKLGDKTGQETERSVRKSLVYELEEQSNVDTSAGQAEADLTRKDKPELLNVGLDTQMAAEAMEALFYGDGMADCDAQNDHQGKTKESPRTNAKSILTKQLSSDNNCDTSITTRQSKKIKSVDAKSNQSSISTQKYPDNVRKVSYADVHMTRRKRSKLDAEEPLTVSGSKAANKIPSKIIEQRRVEGAVENCQIDEFDRSCVTAARGDGSAKKRHLLNELATFTPVTRRTRRFSVISQRKSAVDVPRGCGEETNHFETPKVMNASGRSSEVGSSQHGKLESKSKLIAMPNNVLSCLKRRRSCRNLGHLNEHDYIDAQSKQSGQLGITRKSTCGQKRPRSDSNVKRKTQPHNKSNADPSPYNENRVNENSEKSPKQTSKPSELACSSPTNCTTPVNAASPVCVGDGYLKHSCKKNLAGSCLVRELSNLCTTSPKPISSPKDSRKRKDLSNVRVLFSHHLDDDIIKQQTKIAERLNISIASSIKDATHFITDKFVRTRNMLEAIASGKPVMTNLWLENIGETNYYIDESNYILRDMKKEKEFGFNMAVSLTRARRHPLLQGQRVLVTPNAKPGKEIISSLVKAVGGRAIERVGRSALKDDILPDLLVLSCEEDYEVCAPFLEKGVVVYSSELLLNGIVTQKLEYDRHLLFADQVKRTRTKTILLKRDGHNFVPISKHK